MHKPLQLPQIGPLSPKRLVAAPSLHNAVATRSARVSSSTFNEVSTTVEYASRVRCKRLFGIPLT
jgi:hypothetical protein